ncbi:MULTISPECIES: peptidoglycan-binding domain-containing protein [unclassified Streptomyces]|uniref:peptidoglycan-binding domain-containing protein n=1 Tax=unclassified Streptomyces TaxID=2593676 RepID=UPI002366FB9B|nr:MULTISPECIES: peptidoglycan-binding domain-containing protein [unclassified Streptomyces]MDF3144537.1 peptidoglycan-binding domain-containing protein [Streptomyces sp. T21Q-yed]WDF40692.1 peptidoglycan-binding domain-containing protein [Streptomyces sp. T12]
MLRTKAGLAAGATLLAGLGLAGITATPANAATHWCNKTMGDFIGGGNGHELAQIPAYNSTFDCITAEGASGSHVKAIQNALRHCHGRTKVEVDGHFGPITEAELMKVQAALHLEDDGVYGPKTRDKLKWRSSNGHCATLP